jgi:DHA1 family bicyclomycin/chloramphenicol resistance-like MFS transporter
VRSQLIANSALIFALVCDRLEGPAVQKLLSQMTMIFGLAPAIAPVFGG